MEDLQTDYGKDQNPENTDVESETKNQESASAANLLNGCDDIDDPLDLMDHSDNASIGSNSDVWKGSDSEEEAFDDKEVPNGDVEINKGISSDVSEVPTNTEDKNESGQCNKDEKDEAEQISPISENKMEQEVGDSENKNPDDAKTDSEIEKKSIPPEERTENISLKEDENQSTEKTSEEIHEVKPEEKESPQDKEEKIACSNKETPNEVDTLKENSIASSEPLLPVESKKSKHIQEEQQDPLAVNDVNKQGMKDSPQKISEKNIEQHGHEEDFQMDYKDDDDDDDDDDFDPLLLCPEVSMAVDENQVITNNNIISSDEHSSPIPCEPAFSTYVDEVTGAEVAFNLTAEEHELRKRLFRPSSPVQFSRIHCTACNIHLGSALDGQSNRFVHPLLKVLICKECYHFYTSGEFEKDEDGSELYCRWCGQGGQVLCCSKCEFVFCKRCIRTNFNRKKMLEIRDSDNWNCFRCAPNQLISQRVTCYEFFDYIRKEMVRASSMVCGAEVWSKDYTRCCSLKKRALEDCGEMKKPKKRKNVDPDYLPTLDDLERKTASGLNPVSVLPKSFSKGKTYLLSKSVQFIPKLQSKNSKDNDVEFVRTIPAPQVGISAIKSNTTVPSYRTILPTPARTVLHTPTVVRLNSQSLPPLVPATSRLMGSTFQHQRNNAQSSMKHEWFEKTVRAAARVNSHLSYTLTQLNKAQSQAASVEELAVVHNKLQEILSSSINSLIQIRKNLRTEFIAGIKTVRLPSKKAPETFSNDDDVIFVSAPATIPLPALSPETKSSDPIIIIDNSTKLPASTTSESKTVVEKKSTERPRLKVKSMMELQNVPSECITIPDEEIKEGGKDGKLPNCPKEDVVCNGKVKEVEPAKGSKSSSIDCSSLSSENVIEKTSAGEDNGGKSTTQDSVLGNATQKADNVRKCKLDVSKKENLETKKRRSKGDSKHNKIVYNIKDEPTVEIKRMLSVTVNLPRVNLIDLQKRLPNGCH